MNLEMASSIAGLIVEKLKPYCEKIEIAGSIRRKKGWVHDIDIVAVPSNQGHFAYALQQIGKIKMGGHKLIRCEMPEGLSIDVYVATPETWATLLLIWTGSKKHNIMLCKEASRQGKKLHADGSGLFSLHAEGCETMRERRIAGDTEESIFQALGMRYKKPEERE